MPFYASGGLTQVAADLLYIALSYLDTDAALAANSDAKLATQKAVKAYIDGLLDAANATVMVDGIDCSTFPNYPAADSGHLYVVSVAGKLGGESGVDVEVNDIAICKADGTAAGTQAAVGASWVVINKNIGAATPTAPGTSELATSEEITTATDQARTITPDALRGSGYGVRVAYFALSNTVALDNTKKAYMRIPSVMNGWKLVSATAMAKVGSTAGMVELSVKNGSTDMLSTNIFLDEGETDSSTATTQPVIDTAHNSVATGDQIEVGPAGATAGTGVLYCVVELQFQKPGA
jgi:hypothetical protein